MYRRRNQRDKLISEELVRYHEIHNTAAAIKKVLILGGTNSGKSTFYNFLCFNNNSSISDEFMERNVLGFVFRCILFCYKSLKHRLPNQFSNLEDDVRKCIRSRKISIELKNFMRYVRYQEFEFMMEASFYVRYMNNIKYFFSEEFISRLEFKVNFLDLSHVKIPRKFYTVREIDIQEYQKFKFIDPSALKGEPRKWISHFEHVDAVYYLISLADYMLIDEVSNMNCLELALETFYQLKQSRLFSIFIILLTKTDELEHLLKYYPFHQYISNFNGDNTKEEVIRYVQHSCTLYHSETCEIFIYQVNLTNAPSLKLTLSSTLMIYNTQTVL